MNTRYMLQEVTVIRPVRDYQVDVTFADGFTGQVDLAPLLECGGEVFERWRDMELFRRVTVNETGSPEWPGGLDLSPGALRAWCEAGRFMDYDETDEWIERHDSPRTGMVG